MGEGRKIEHDLSPASIRKIYSYLGDNVTKGYRTGKTMSDEETYYIEECTADHGLQTKLLMSYLSRSFEI